MKQTLQGGRSASLLFERSKCGQLFQWFRAIECRDDGDDASLLVEGEAVDAYFAMGAGYAIAEIYIVPVDAMIDDVPLVVPWYLEDGVVGGAIDLVIGPLFNHAVAILVESDGAEGRFGCAVAHMIVGRAGVIDAP